MTATTEPTSVTAGDTITWLKTLADYPASAGWVLSYVLINATQRYTATATPQGADHLLQVSAATSAVWVAGRYTWKALVSRAGERHTVGEGVITVAPDVAAAGATPLDTRTAARAALDAVEAALRTYGAKAYLQSYSIGGRQQTFRSPSDFMAFRSRLQAEVRREEAGNGQALSVPRRNSIAVRFRT